MVSRRFFIVHSQRPYIHSRNQAPGKHHNSELKDYSCYELLYSYVAVQWPIHLDRYQRVALEQHDHSTPHVNLVDYVRVHSLHVDNELQCNRISTIDGPQCSYIHVQSAFGFVPPAFLRSLRCRCAEHLIRGLRTRYCTHGGSCSDVHILLPRNHTYLCICMAGWNSLLIIGNVGAPIVSNPSAFQRFYYKFNKMTSEHVWNCRVRKNLN